MMEENINIDGRRMFMDNNGYIKNQNIFYNYEHFLDSVDLSDRIVIIMTYDFDEKDFLLSDLMVKLKSSNARIHNFKIKDKMLTIENIFSIIDFMEKNTVDTIIGIGDDFLSDIVKGITVFYDNRNINNLHELKENKTSLSYEKLKESIFIPTTGGGSEFHRYFKLVDRDSSDVIIFDDSRCKIDNVVLDSRFSKESSIECIIYYIFSTIVNLVDVIFNDNVDNQIRLEVKDIINESFLLLESADRFGESMLFREKILKFSMRSSNMIDKFGYGILYLYGNLIESIFSVPKHNIDALGIEFFSQEVKKKYSLIHIASYFDIDINTFYKYKSKYGLKDTLSYYKLDSDMVNKIKRIGYDYLVSNRVTERYTSLNFNENMNERLFEYYLNGVNFD